MNMKKLTLISAVIFSAAFTAASQAQTTTSVVDDNYAVDGTAATDASFFASSTSSALEITPNAIELVSGSSGRQIHGIFPTQTLDTGDTLTATVTFVTPATVAGTNEDLRIGLFDHLGRGDAPAGVLFQNTSYSSSNTNADWSGLPGFYSEIDVESDDSATDMDIREAGPSTTGRHISTSSGFSGLGSGPDLGYDIVANTTYVYTMTVENNGDGTSDITVQLDGLDARTNTTTMSLTNIGLIALGSSSGAFGSTSSTGQPDNGIDITSLTIDYFDADGVEEPPVEPADDAACYTIPTATGGAAVVCL